MSHNTGECKVNSPIECECIDFNFDHYDQFSQWSKNEVTKIKGANNGVLFGRGRAPQKLPPKVVFLYYYCM